MRKTLNPVFESILRKLYLNIKDSKNNKVKETSITYYVGCFDDINNYVDATNFLKSNKIIEEIKEHSSKEETDNEGNITLFFEETYIFKPSVLIGFLIETSRIPKYTLSFDKSSCMVMVNNKYLLSKLDFDGINYNFFSYVIDNPNKIIRKEDIYQYLGIKEKEKIEKRDLLSIILNVIRNKDLIKIFFPQISKDSAYFRNDVTIKDLVGHKINEKNINDYFKKMKTIKG